MRVQYGQAGTRGSNARQASAAQAATAARTGRSRSRSASKVQARITAAPSITESEERPAIVLSSSGTWVSTASGSGTAFQVQRPTVSREPSDNTKAAGVVSAAPLTTG